MWSVAASQAIREQILARSASQLPNPCQSRGSQDSSKRFGQGRFSQPQGVAPAIAVFDPGLSPVFLPQVEANRKLEWNQYLANVLQTVHAALLRFWQGAFLRRLNRESRPEPKSWWG